MTSRHLLMSSWKKMAVSTHQRNLPVLATTLFKIRGGGHVETYHERLIQNKRDPYYNLRNNGNFHV